MLLLWYLKMFAAHLLTDFALQPNSWVEGRNAHHYKSRHIYYHIAITVLIACLFDGFTNWIVPVVIGLSHFFIDLWKSYKPQRIQYFVLDQALHLLIILVTGLLLYAPDPAIATSFKSIFNNENYWAVTLALVFLAQPSGIIIGMLTRRWREQLADTSNSLADAGKWIGILERLIIFVLVVFNQYAAIALLTAAKSILRFSESKNAQERSEYVLIGTLISITFALVAGLIIKTFLPLSI
ncbi:uncharacterized protein DUF3307 [Arcticibacter pallidicorallinus]|uniref:Uncharacterized protein DUF3307 n=1 Tax=Arcticibacter pallidicorallinus TaxID=1259464 RepID=A0A2T0U2X2_9SPHI|nr:DUF3307 domain-containing protein [Arcticibacter pallidicorallinus]PRY52264.1 uncharacterized protein DUF3307 [Arcticibacter pallidicorallinus]